MGSLWFRRSCQRVCMSGLVVVLVMVLFWNIPLHLAYASTSLYYLGLGDSLAYGEQPSPGDTIHGYVQDWFNTDLINRGVSKETDYGCGGETSTQMISTAGCPSGKIHDQWPNYSTISQLTAAVNFIDSPPQNGQVSQVTIDIGGDDMTPSFQRNTCEYGNNSPLQIPPVPSWTAELAQLDTDLRQPITGILPQLVTALQAHGSGALIMLNYYNYLTYTYPIPSNGVAPTCPTSIPYVQQNANSLYRRIQRCGCTVCHQPRLVPATTVLELPNGRLCGLAARLGDGKRHPDDLCRLLR